MVSFCWHCCKRSHLCEGVLWGFWGVFFLQFIWKLFQTVLCIMCCSSSSRVFYFFKNIYLCTHIPENQKSYLFYITAENLTCIISTS